MPTISQSIAAYLDSVHLARSESTAKTYSNALNAFALILEEKELPPEESGIEKLSEDAIIWFAASLKTYAPATERLYLTAVTGFYEYLAAEKLTEINLPRLRLLIRQRARRPGQRLPQFPRDAIEQVLAYSDELRVLPVENDAERLRNLRDRAFLFTLSDTGLRVHEACGLRRGDIDWNEGKAIIVGKGDREAIVRFSQRSIGAVKDYLSTRWIGWQFRTSTHLPPPLCPS